MERRRGQIHGIKKETRKRETTERGKTRERERARVKMDDGALKVPK
jgi:hypothetical protein